MTLDATLGRRPLRVLHLLNGSRGGAANSTAELVSALRDLNVSSVAVCEGREGGEVTRALAQAFDENVELLRLFSWNRKSRTTAGLRPAVALRQLARTGAGARSARAVVQLARRWNVDLIHTNTFLTPEGAIAARVLGIPHVWHVRELLGPGRPYRIRGEGTRLAAAVGRDVVIVNSPVTGDCFRRVVPGVETELIPNGLALTRLADVAGARSRDDQTRPMVVAVVASLTANWKRHQHFVRAAAECRPARAVEFRIYGEDPSQSAGASRKARRYSDAIHRLVTDLGLAERLTFRGFVDDPAEIMSEVDVLVQPSDSESFGRTVVEAMASGVTIVGVDNGPFPWLADSGRAGIVVPADDIGELARAIELVVDDPTLAADLRRRARARSLSEFSVEHCAEKVRHAYDKAFSEAPRQTSALTVGWFRYHGRRLLPQARLSTSVQGS